MAADQTLVQGAYNLAEDFGGKVRAAKDKAYQDVVKTIQDLQATKDREKEEMLSGYESTWNENASYILENDGITPGNHDAIFDEVQRLKGLYDGFAGSDDKKGMSKTLTDLRKLREGFDLHQGIMTTISSNKKNGHVSKGTSPENRIWYSKLSSGEIQPYMGADGEFGLEGPDGNFIKMSSVDDIIESDEIYFEGKNNINALSTAILKEATEGSQFAKYQSSAVEESIRGIVDIGIAEGKFKSMVNDPMFGSTSFREDLFEADMLKGVKYSDLGIDNIGADEFISPDDNILKQDRVKIIDLFLSSDSTRDHAKEMFIKYINKHCEMQFNNGIKAVQERHDDALAKKNKQLNLKYSSEDLNKIIQEMIDDGTYKPPGGMRGGDGSDVPLGKTIDGNDGND